MRKLPQLTEDTRPFWTGGANDQLLIHRCGDCARFFHPPAPVCRHCASENVAPTPVSGRGKVIACTINKQAWTPEFAEPFSIAIVELEEQAGLRFTTNVIGCPPEEVTVGLPVKVAFEQVEDVFIPLFERAG